VGVDSGGDTIIEPMASVFDSKKGEPGRENVRVRSGEPRDFGVGSSGAAGDEASRRLARLKFVARLMDNSIEVPGLKSKVGLDPIIGLIPGVGDAITTAISLYIVYEGYKLGATQNQIARMIGNVAVDALVGTVPVLGDLFDFAFKANQRNLKILGIDPAGP